MADTVPSSFAITKSQVKVDGQNKQQSSCSVIRNTKQELRSEVCRISSEIENVQEQITHCNQLIDTIDHQVHVTMNERNNTYQRKLSRFFTDLCLMFGWNNSKHG